MNKLFYILTFFICTNVYASKPVEQSNRKIAQVEIQCGKTVNDNLTMISIAPGCYEAINIAKTCAWGSSGDSAQVSAAQKICEKDFKKISKTDLQLKKQMHDRCGKLCDPASDGTMCIAQIAFCSLSATEFWAQFYSAGMNN